MTLVEALIVVVLATGVCVAVGVVLTEPLRRRYQPYEPPDGWGAVADDKVWEKDARALAHSSLKDVRESAKSWAASISALLGVGGTVAFVKGEETFAKLSNSTGNFVFWLTIAAAVLAGVAIGLATFAAQGTPRRYKDLDGWTFKQVSKDRAKRAMDLLIWSRILTVVAAMAILVGLALTWEAGIASDNPSTATTAIATTADGVTRCGELGVAEDGALSLLVDETELPLREGADVDTVDDCPAVSE